MPSDGQRAAVEFLLSHSCAALWADPGAGKTSITLTAFVALQQAGVARKMLVIAPLRVCQLTWRQETSKWAHTRHLTVSLIHGNKKAQAAEAEADIYLINYEGLAWLEKHFKGRPLPYDTVVCDEITKVKNAQSKRSKSLRKLTARTPRRWGLTGTPAPNGYLDLFGQYLWVDQGASLGGFYSHYRQRFFQPSFDGFNWDLQKGAEERIHKAIADCTFRLSYTDLPSIRDNPIFIELDAASRKAYDEMKKEALIETEDGIVTAANSAAVYSKLKQMANGAVYVSDNTEGKRRTVAHIHDAKLDALEDLVEELSGQPLLVAYEFQHDLARIQARFPGTPYLGSGVSEKDAVRIQREWNEGKIKILACHPASVGHGLNFQEGGAGHLVWFSASFDLELYEQFIRRIRRQGNPNERVVNHQLIVRNTIDEVVFASLVTKDTTQARLLQGIASLLRNEDQTEAHMAIQKLPFQGQAGAPQAPAPQPQQQPQYAPQPPQYAAPQPPQQYAQPPQCAPPPPPPAPPQQPVSSFAQQAQHAPVHAQTQQGQQIEAGLTQQPVYAPPPPPPAPAGNVPLVDPALMARLAGANGAHGVEAQPPAPPPQQQYIQTGNERPLQPDPQPANVQTDAGAEQPKATRSRSRRTTASAATAAPGTSAEPSADDADSVVNVHISFSGTDPAAVKAAIRAFLDA